MTASRSFERGARAVAWPVPPRGLDGVGPAALVRAAGATAAGAALVCGAVIAARRLSGAIGPAGPALLLGTASVGVALVLAADAARRAGAALGVSLAARCGLLLAMAALAVPLTAADISGRLVAGMAFVAAAVAVVRLPRSPAADRGDPRERGRPAAGRRERQGSRAPRPGVLRQRFERRELPAGAECVRGRVVVAVPAAARTGYGHLGFCPAFSTTPAVEVSTAYDGVEVTVTAAEVVPWGVRVECRLAEPAEEPLEIAVDLVATSVAPADDGQAADTTP